MDPWIRHWETFIFGFKIWGFGGFQTPRLSALKGGFQEVPPVMEKKPRNIHPPKDERLLNPKVMEVWMEDVVFPEFLLGGIF